MESPQAQNGRENEPPPAPPAPRADRPLEWARYCLDCHYPLEGLDSHRCPECGRPFDPSDPDSYSREPVKRRLPPLTSPWVRARALVLLAGLLVGGNWAIWSMAREGACLFLGAVPLWSGAMAWLAMTVLHTQRFHGVAFRIAQGAILGAALCLPHPCVMSLGTVSGGFAGLVRAYLES